MEIVGRLGSNEVDCAACRVLPEKCALRALQHFNTFNVKINVGRQNREGVTDLIEIKAYGGVSADGIFQEAHAANRNDGCSRWRVCKGHRRNCLGQILKIGNLTVLKHITRQSCNGQADAIK